MLGIGVCNAGVYNAEVDAAISMLPEFLEEEDAKMSKASVPARVECGARPPHAPAPRHGLRLRFLMAARIRIWVGHSRRATSC